MLNTTNPNRGQKTVESSLYGLANMLALIASFLVCPQIYDLSADAVYAYLLRNYGDADISLIGTYVFTGLVTACVYFFSRALIVLALILIAQRLLVFMF